MLSQLRDIKKLLAVIINSSSPEEAKTNKATLTYLETCQLNLIPTLNNLLINNGHDPLFDIWVELNEDEATKFDIANTFLAQFKEDPKLKNAINFAFYFRRIFFEILETEDRYIKRCHEIDNDTITQIKRIASSYFVVNAAKKAEFEKLAPLLDQYQTITNQLAIDFNTGVSFANDPFAAVKFLKKQFSSAEFEVEYEKLEQITINFGRLNLLLAEVSQNFTEHRFFLEPILSLLIEPMQRTARYPLLLKQATDGERLNVMTQFYEEHSQEQLQRFKKHINSMNQLLARMEHKASAINEKIRAKELAAANHQIMLRSQELLTARESHEALRNSNGLENSKSRNIFALLSPFDKAADKMLIASAHNGDIQLAKEALLRGANINARAAGLVWGNFTALIIAAHNGGLEYVEFLLGLNFSVHPLDTRAQTGTSRNPYNTALHWAVRKGHSQIVKLLFDIDPDSSLIQSDENGYTPLHYAIEGMQVEAIRILITFCSPKALAIRDKKGRTPLMMAFDSSAEVVMIFLQLLTSDTKYREELTKARQYMAAKNNIAKMDSKDRVLLNAAKQGDRAALDNALKLGANINVRDQDTPLLLASRHNHLACVEQLLNPDFSKWQVNTSALTNVHYGENALHFAAKNGNVKMCELLVAADPYLVLHAEDENDYLPLHVAIINRHFEVVKFLLTAHEIEQLFILSKDGSTAFKLSLNVGADLIAHYLFGRTKHNYTENTFPQSKEKLTTIFQLAVGYCYLKIILEDYSKTNNNLGKQLLKRLVEITNDEILLLLDILNLSDKKLSLQDFLQGAFIKINDGGQRYQKWSQFSNKQDRSRPGLSSHRSLDPQFAILGPFISTCLIGTDESNGSKHTWIQAERFPLNIANALAHGINYIQYKLTKKNIGPYGQSPHTQANPIISNHGFWSDPIQDNMQKLVETVVSKYLEARANDIAGKLDSDIQDFCEVVENNELSQLELK